MSKNKYKIIRVDWIDSSATRGWTYMPEHKEQNLLVHSIGYLLKENKTEITISTSYTPHESAMDPLTIPKVAIKSRKFIK